MVLIGLPLVALFIISLGGYLTAEITKCVYSKRYAKMQADSYFLTAVASALCALTLVLLSGFSFPSSAFSVLLGLLFGIAVMGHLCASSMAISIGPWSYTSIMVSLAIVVPTFSGAIFWGETIEWLDYVGVALMAVCLICSVQKEADGKKGNIKWLLLSILAMVCMASIGLLQKTHQTSDHKGEVTVFLTTAFAFAAVCSAIICLVLRKRAHVANAADTAEKQPISPKKRLAVLILLCLGVGAGMAINHCINLYLSGALDSVLFFPVMCGCELCGVTLTSLLLFKEKLSKKQWFGFICGVSAVLVLCV